MSKNKKRKMRRERAKEDDDFDGIFKKYQEKLEKKLGKMEKKDGDESFEEVDV